MSDELTDRQKAVIRLWAEGKTGNYIAGMLGITRNAVIGIVSRLKYKGYLVDPLKLHRKAAGGRPRKIDSPAYTQEEARKRAILSLKSAEELLKDVRAAPEGVKRPTGRRPGRQTPLLPGEPIQHAPRYSPRYENETAPERDGDRWVDFFEVSSTGCKFPRGLGPYKFCNDTRRANSPYCEHHTQMAVNRDVQTYTKMIKDKVAA
jgi:hypothetical protein